MKVLIVDDHPVVLSGCRALLAGEPDCEVFVAQDGDSALQIFDQERPDVLALDVNLPKISGFELAQKILGRDATAKILLFSMNDDPAFVARGFEIGARGFLGKNDDPALLATALRDVASGQKFLPPTLARKMAFRVQGSRLAGLSARELDILRLLAAGRSIGDIAGDLGVSSKTVANNCTVLRQKLGARSAMELMRIAVETRSADDRADG